MDHQKMAPGRNSIPVLFMELLSQIFSTNTTLTENFNVIARIPENETIEIESGITVQITGS